MKISLKYPRNDFSYDVMVAIMTQCILFKIFYVGSLRTLFGRIQVNFQNENFS